MTIATYFLITIVLFITLSVWYKRSRNKQTGIWYMDLEGRLDDTDRYDALVFISFCSLLWPICIPIGILVVCIVKCARAWHRWMDKH